MSINSPGGLSSLPPVGVGLYSRMYDAQEFGKHTAPGSNTPPPQLNNSHMLRNGLILSAAALTVAALFKGRGVGKEFNKLVDACKTIFTGTKPDNIIKKAAEQTSENSGFWSSVGQKIKNAWDSFLNIFSKSEDQAVAKMPFADRWAGVKDSASGFWDSLVDNTKELFKFGESGDRFPGLKRQLEKVGLKIPDSEIENAERAWKDLSFFEKAEVRLKQAEVFTEGIFGKTVDASGNEIKNAARGFTKGALIAGGGIACTGMALNVCDNITAKNYVEAKKRETQLNGLF